jgi:hypothetical protein
MQTLKTSVHLAHITESRNVIRRVTSRAWVPRCDFALLCWGLGSTPYEISLRDQPVPAFHQQSHAHGKLIWSCMIDLQKDFATLMSDYLSRSSTLSRTQHVWPHSSRPQIFSPWLYSRLQWLQFKPGMRRIQCQTRGMYSRIALNRLYMGIQGWRYRTAYRV